MPKSLRKTCALGLSLLGLAAFMARLHAQNESSAKPAAQPAAPPAIPPALIGTIDMERVFREYKKLKAASDKFQADRQAKVAELQKLAAQGQQLAKQLDELAPGSNDFRQKESEITRLRAQLEAEKEQAQAEFMRREADNLATIYKEIQAMTAAVARHKGLTYVIKVSDEPIAAGDPNSVIAAMNRSVVYHHPATDVTDMVIHNLNLVYEQQLKAQGATTDPATRPAAATTAGAPGKSAVSRPAPAPTPPAATAPQPTRR